MRILIVGECLDRYLAKCHEAFRTGIRRTFDTRVFGTGYPGFNPDLLSYQDIVRHVFPDQRPDLIITDFDIALPEFKLPYVGLHETGIPSAIYFGDYWGVTEGHIPEFQDFIDRSGISIVISYFPQPLRIFPPSLAAKLVWVPACVDPALFNEWGAEKEYDVGFLAAGSTEYTNFYPERFAIHRALRRQNHLKYLWAEHPGWERHPAEHPMVGAGFSKKINACRIFITTGGRYRNLHAKYFEILASKSVLFADYAEGAEEMHFQDGENYVRIEAHNILDKIDYYLARPDELSRIAEAGYLTAMKYHSCYARALDFRAAVVPRLSAGSGIGSAPDKAVATSKAGNGSLAELMREAGLADAVAIPGSKGKLLCVYDPVMGHSTLHVRGLIFKDEYLRRGWDIRFLDYRQAGVDEIVRQASECDAVYLLKVADLRVYQQLKEKTKAKIIFDLSDTLWAPVHQAAGWTDLDRILALADAIFSENEWICAYGRKFTSNVYVVPPCTKPERFDAIKASLPARDPDTLVVGWVGSTGTARSLHKVGDALDALALKYRNLEFRILGCADPLELPAFRELIFSVHGAYDEDRMMREILSMDIGIFPAPLDMEDYKYRGALKAKLYMSGGVPAVCHNFGDCATMIKDGVTGMLVDKTEDWYVKLDQLLGDAALRKRMGRAAYESIRAEHTMEHVFTILENSLLKVIGRA